MSLNLNKTNADIYVFIFKRKDNKKGLTDQDKKHVRFMAVYHLIKNDNFAEVMRHEFTEKFKYDADKNEVTYLIKLKRKRGLQNAESQSNDKPN